MRAADLGDPFEQPFREPQPRGLGQPGELAGQPGADPWAFQRCRGELGFEVGRDRDQVPAQPVDHPGSFADDLIAIVTEHADLHRVLVAERMREALDPVAHHGQRHRARVDQIRP